MLVYTVRISGVKDGSHEDCFDINGKFFESFVNYDVTNCEIKVISVLMKDGNKLKLNLDLKGEIYNLLCDLCASEITIPVDNSISVLLHENEEEIDNTDEIIYIKPNGTNTINGVGVSLSLAPAASGIMACGGSSTNWSSVGITRTMIVAKTTTFYNNNSDDGTTNQITGTYTPQLGTSMLICVGSCTAGAQHSGAGGSYYYRSGGSGGSSYAEKFIASPAASYAYTISGKGNTSYNDNTSATKTTTVAGMTCTRGAGPPVQSTGSAHLSGRTGGTATGGTVNFTGGTGATPSATGNVGRNAGGGGAATRAGNGGNGASNAGGGTGGNNASQDTAGAAATAKDSNSYAVPNSTAETYQAGVAFTGTGEVDSRNPTGASPKTLVNIGSVSFAIADHENLTTGASGGAGGAGYSRSATQGGYITFVEFI